MSSRIGEETLLKIHSVTELKRYSGSGDRVFSSIQSFPLNHHQEPLNGGNKSTQWRIQELRQLWAQVPRREIQVDLRISLRRSARILQTNSSKYRESIFAWAYITTNFTKSGQERNREAGDDGIDNLL